MCVVSKYDMLQSIIDSGCVEKPNRIPNHTTGMASSIPSSHRLRETLPALMSKVRSDPIYDESTEYGTGEMKPGSDRR